MNIKAILLSVLFAIALPFSNMVNAEEQAPNSQHEGIKVTVNVNQASPQEIADLLKGVGIKKAQAIVDYRKEHGLFEKVEDLAKVTGIGEATVAKNYSRIQLSD
ncbi:hypothetical protein DZ860_13930 [Vibrio sinensis]|uniref:Helix-hairpin-helix DNA-binding motif class 1 domain-containing protein n=1 Tax=Vibrio sinensis TaxID=2302434 RepID=A0A3A6QNV8_9VIBR|nr:helix-hairpin-helix domain-containing protein [Vibrio sinensis]RJX69987.1 hypothetical protein DZ860_13930 [Vibrio sinensis]